jgi:hypothetical protein
MEQKIQIITTVSAWPEALEYQSKLLKKYCEDDFEFIAVIDTDPRPHFSNLWTRNARNKAIKIAQNYCDDVIEFPHHLHKSRLILFPETMEFQKNKASLRTADACQFAWQYLKKRNSKRALLIDSDMFPIDRFNFKSMVKEKNVGAIYQIRENASNKIEYFWNGLLAADFGAEPSLLDISFDAGVYNEFRTDTGGATYKWVLNNYEKIKWLNFLSSLDWSKDQLPEFVTPKLREFIQSDDRNKSSNFYSEIYADAFFHFRAGGNWNAESTEIVVNRRIKLFEAFCEMLDEQLNADLILPDKSVYSRFSESKYHLIEKLKNFLRDKIIYVKR